MGENCKSVFIPLKKPLHISTNMETRGNGMYKVQQFGLGLRSFEQLISHERSH